MRALLLSLLVGFPAWGALGPGSHAWAQSPANDPGESTEASVEASLPDGESTHARQLLVRGMTRAYLDDHEAAIAYYEQALELASDEASVLSALAESHAARSDLSSALFYARQARESAPDNPHYHRQLAELQRASGNPDAAIETYRAMIDRFPDHLSARTELAQVQSETGRTAEAAATYESILENSDAPRPRVHLDLLQLYRQMDNLDGVERTLKALIDLRPDEPLYRHLLGDLYAEHNRIEDAIALYERLLPERPGDTDLVMRLAMLYRRNGQPEEASALMRTFIGDANATADQLVARARSLARSASADPASPDSGLIGTATRLLRRALDRTPDHTDALELLGELRYEAGAFREAGGLLEKALQDNPRAPERWTMAASAYLQAGAFQEAADIADEGLLLFPGQYPLVRVNAFALLRLNRNRAAIRTFRDALDLLEGEAGRDQERASLYAALGLLYSRLEDHTASDAAYEQALAANPTEWMAANNYAFNLAERRVNLDRALELGRRVVEADSTNAAFLDTLGWVHFQRGNPQKALQYIQKAVATGSASAAVYEHLGDVHAALGNDAQARRSWQTALERAPDREALKDKLNALQ